MPALIHPTNTLEAHLPADNLTGNNKTQVPLQGKHENCLYPRDELSGEGRPADGWIFNLVHEADTQGMFCQKLRGIGKHGDQGHSTLANGRSQRLELSLEFLKNILFEHK